MKISLFVGAGALVLFNGCGGADLSGQAGTTSEESASTSSESGETDSTSETQDATSLDSTGDGDGAGDGDGEGDDGTGDGDGDGESGDCAPLPPATGETLTVSPTDSSDLPEIVGNAASGTTILFEDGTYDISGAKVLHMSTPGVSLRSLSGDRDSVVIDAGYAIGEILLIQADDITIADMTLQRAMWHPIHITGKSDSHTDNTVIYNVKVVDAGQQAIKINDSIEDFHSDNGSVACSHVEMTDAGRTKVTDCYTGGIDAHSAWGWTIRDNYFEGFWCEQGLSEHAVHFWVSGRDTLVERNVIVDCARGVGFGLGASGNGNERVYEDDPCPGADYLGHVDGIIRNNTIWAARPDLFSSVAGFDSGVALEQACGAEVYHNTIVSLQPPFVSIEYRFPNTDAMIKNNLVTHSITQRDGGQAVLVGNIEDAELSHFVDVMGGDIHLVSDSPAVNAGVELASGKADTDIDGDLRDATPDVGADEVVR